MFCVVLSYSYLLTHQRYPKKYGQLDLEPQNYAIFHYKNVRTNHTTLEISMPGERYLDSTPVPYFGCILFIYFKEFWLHH